MYQICERSLGIELPNYQDINRVQAQMISSILAPMRFAGPVTGKSLAEIEISLKPYDRLCFLMPSFAGLTREDSFPSEGEATVKKLVASCLTNDT